MIGDLVAALDDRAQHLRVVFADPPRREDCRLDAMRIAQLDEPPNSPFAICIWRFIEQPARQHRVEIVVKLTAMRIPFGQARSGMNWWQAA